MKRILSTIVTAALCFAVASPTFAHSDHKWMKGPQGGHIVDAGGGKQHWELVAKGHEMTLYVLDADEKPLSTEGGTAKGQVLINGKTHDVDFKPAGSNTMTATGEFTAAKGMKVIVSTSKVGGESFQARLAPMH
jgi:hypothetical protein